MIPWRVSERPMAVDEVLRSSRGLGVTRDATEAGGNLTAPMTMYRAVGTGFYVTKQWPKRGAVNSAGGRWDSSVPPPEGI